MLYSEELWNLWVEKIQENFQKKTYHHFDHPVDFDASKEKIKEIVKNPAKVASHSFIPLVKILIKTPRYKYQEELGGSQFLSAKEKEKFYDLETKIRPISFSSHFDRFIYGFYSFSLTDKYQKYIRAKGFSDCVYAYRNDLDEKCNIQFAKEVFDFVKKLGTCTAIALDIKGYFDSIDHQKLKEKWCRILGDDISELPEDQYKIFKSLTKYSYINNSSILKHFKIDLKEYKKQFKKTPTLTDVIPGKTFNEKFNNIRKNNLVVINDSHELTLEGKKRYFGIPQGSPISALLSNIYLIDFDKEIFELSKNEKFLYRRYCDDLIIIAPSEKAKDYHKLLLESIDFYHLEIQEKKTEIIQFKLDKSGKLRGYDLKKIERDEVNNIEKSEESYFKNLQYLGFEFNGHKTFIRTTSLSRYFRKMQRRIVKTVSMSYSKKAKSNKIYKNQLFERYSHFGKRNFYSYALNASKEFYTNINGDLKEGMNSPEIKKQLAQHVEILTKKLHCKTEKRIKQKLMKKRPVKIRR